MAIYHGMLIEMLDEMAKIANFTYSVYETPDGAYGHQVDGKWVGMVGEVLYKVRGFLSSPSKSCISS